MKNNLEEVWENEFESWDKERQKSRLVFMNSNPEKEAYLEARKKSQDELDSLRTQLLAQCKISKELLTEKEELEQELQKARDDIEFWKNEYVSHSETMCKCQQELQRTREQLEKAESVLKVSVDINVSGWETYRMANQYFKDKDKQGE